MGEPPLGLGRSIRRITPRKASVKRDGGIRQKGEPSRLDIDASSDFTPSPA